MANRLRRETILSVKAIAERLHLGSPKSVRARLPESKTGKGGPKASAPNPENAGSSIDNVALL